MDSDPLPPKSEFDLTNMVRDFGKPVTPGLKESVVEAVRKLEREKTLDKTFDKQQSDDREGPNFSH